MWTIDASVWTNADSPSETGSALSRTFLGHVVSARGCTGRGGLLRVLVLYNLA